MRSGPILVAALLLALPLQAQETGPGFFLQTTADEAERFVPWKSEQSLNRELRRMTREGVGGTVRFAPGTYVIEQGLVIARIPGIRISGSAGVTLEFAPGPERTPRTLAPANEGDETLRIDHAGDLKPGQRYQLYTEQSDLNRVLEFTVASVEGQTVRLEKPVAYMPLIQSIPAGCRVIEEVNFFRVLGSPDTVVENLTLDGKGRGDIRGHTIFGGIYATGLLVGAQRPKVSGLTVRGCRFQGLAGRGVAAYGIADVLIEECVFTDIRAQAVEIDHYSQGLVRRNVVDGAEVGVMVNDAFETVVELNEIRNCWTGVRLLRLFPEEWVNTGNVVRHNTIGPGVKRGVALEDNYGDGPVGNTVERNHFVGLIQGARVIGRRGNRVEANTADD